MQDRAWSSLGRTSIKMISTEGFCRKSSYSGTTGGRIKPSSIGHSGLINLDCPRNVDRLDFAEVSEWSNADGWKGSPRNYLKSGFHYVFVACLLTGSCGICLAWRRFISCGSEGWVCPEFVTEPKQQAACGTHSAASVAATANKQAAEREKIAPEKSNEQHSRS